MNADRSGQPASPFVVAALSLAVAVVLGDAGVVTLASLLPPYLAGYLIDRVVRPTQVGRLTVDAARRMAWIAVGAMALLHVIRQAAAHASLGHDGPGSTA